MSRNQQMTAVVIAGFGGVAALAALLGWTRIAIAALAVVVTAGALLSVLTSAQTSKLAAKQKALLSLPAQITKSSDKFSKHVRDSLTAPVASLSESSDRLVAAIAEARLDAAARHVEITDRFEGDGQIPASLSKVVGDTARLLDENSAINAQLTAVGRTLAKNSSDFRWALQRLQFEPTRQMEALLGLHQDLAPEGPMPGTGGWAMNPTALRSLIHRIGQRDVRLMVECGGGTSSVWIGYALKALGGDRKLVTLEHDEQFAQVTRDLLRDHGLTEFVEIRLAPLVEHGEGDSSYQWYAPEALADLDAVDALLVDGPPSSIGEGARYPALPALAQKLSPGALVFLDDITRPDELAVEARWLDEYPALEKPAVQDSSMHTFVYGSPG